MTRRTLPQNMQDALPLAVPYANVCFRNVAQRFATQQHILSVQGSILAGVRYNFAGTYSVLYLTRDIHKCVEETTRSFQQAGFEAVLAPSAALPRSGKNLCIFLDRLLASSLLRPINTDRLR